MMAKTIKLYVASDQGDYIERELNHVYVNVGDGYMAIFPEHQPEFYRVNIGSVRYADNGKDIEKFFIDGWVQIESDAVRIAAENLMDKISKDYISKLESEIEEFSNKLLSTEDEDKRLEIRNEIAKKQDIVSFAQLRVVS